MREILKFNDGNVFGAMVMDMYDLLPGEWKAMMAREKLEKSLGSKNGASPLSVLRLMKTFDSAVEEVEEGAMAGDLPEFSGEMRHPFAIVLEQK